MHAAVERESAALEGRGRVLLRPSGTEPLVRVMVEAPTADEAEAVCARLVALVEAQLARRQDLDRRPAKPVAGDPRTG